jgi:hypothetical protein
MLDRLKATGFPENVISIFFLWCSNILLSLYKKFMIPTWLLTAVVQWFMNLVYVLKIDTSKIVLALSRNWKETEKFRIFCYESISVGRGATRYENISFIGKVFCREIGFCFRCSFFCSFSIIEMGFDCFTYSRLDYLDGWSTVAVFWVIVCGKIYWKLSDKGDKKEKKTRL